MGFVLKITDGSNTIDFLAGVDFQLMDGGFTMSEPEKTKVWSDPTPEGGEKLLDYRIGNRTAKVVFDVMAPTRNGLAQKLSELTTVLSHARNFAMGKTKDKVLLSYSWDDSTYTNNYDILDGEVILPENVMSVDQIHQQTQAGDYIITEVELDLVVGPFALGSTADGQPLILPLRNRNNPGGAPQLQFTSNYHPTDWAYQEGFHGVGPTFWQDNFVDVNGSDILGDSPAKIMVRLDYYSDWVTPYFPPRIVIGVFKKKNVKLYWDDEEVSIPGGVVVNSADLSWGRGTTKTLAETSLPSYNWFQIQIDNPELYGSEHYRLLVGKTMPLSSPDRTMQYKLQLSQNGSNAIFWDTGWVNETPDRKVIDFGVFRLPPYAASVLTEPFGVFPEAPLKVTVLTRAADGKTGPVTLGLDNIHLIPVEEGYRVFLMDSPIDQFFFTLVDDPYADDVFYVTGIGNDQDKKYRAFHAEYMPITFTPGTDYRIVFYMTGSSPDERTDRVWGAILRYYPTSSLGTW